MHSLCRGDEPRAYWILYEIPSVWQLMRFYPLSVQAQLCQSGVCSYISDLETPNSCYFDSVA